MAATLTFQLKTPILMDQTLADNGGNWQYAAAEASEQPPAKRIAHLIATKRENVAAGVHFAVSMLTATVMFAPKKGHDVPPHLTIQGLHNIKSGNETGSVSSASPDLRTSAGVSRSMERRPY